MANQEVVRGEACGPVQIQMEGFRSIFNEAIFPDSEDGDPEPLLGYVILQQAQAAVEGKRVPPGRRHRSIARLTPSSPMATKVNMPSVTLISSGARPARVRRTQVSTWTVIEVRPMRSVRQWQLTRSPT